MAEANAPCKHVYYSSSRGGTKMELNGFVYNEDKSSDSKVYWRRGCRTCRMVMQSNNSVKITSHTILLF